MNSIREATRDSPDPTLRDLIAEATANLCKKHGIDDPEAPIVELPKRLYDGPKYDGKQCACCQRHFKHHGEYVICRLCQSLLCRRKEECKRLHHAEHRLAARNAQKEGAA